MKVALVYDRVNKWGGAERVLLALHDLFPNAPLYTSVYNPQKAPWAKVFDVKTSFLQKLPLASSSHEILAPLMPLAFESFSFDEYDLVISLTSEAAKGIVTKPKTIHVCYCLTPTRYLWSGYKEYFANSTIRFLSKPAVFYLKTWDKIAAQRPDAYIAISKEVQKRIKKYYGKDSIVIYPPVSLGAEVAYENFLVHDAKKLKGSSRTSKPASVHSENFVGSSRPNRGGYFLVVSRLVPYKRIDIAIEACNKLKLSLKIIGTGKEENRLKSLAGSTIEFLGNLTDEELVSYYKNCRVLIFAGYEDFGLTILEAQSFGKPVIAFKAGGALETVIDGKTGLFFNESTVESLIRAIEQFNNLTIDSVDCVKQASKFSFKTFKEQFMNEILRLMPQDDMEKKI
ncbi:MAG: glycosyltransferase [bacterium]|nr:glycosyltransferase [bacterium]